MQGQATTMPAVVGGRVGGSANVDEHWVARPPADLFWLVWQADEGIKSGELRAVILLS